MTALTANRATSQMVGTPYLTGPISPSIAASTIIYGGSMVGVNSAGAAVPAGVAACVRVLGRARRQVDNSATAVPNANPKVSIEYGTFNWTAAGSFTVADIGKPVYAVDDQTVSLDSSGGRIFAGIFHGLDTRAEFSGEVLVRMYPDHVPGIYELRRELAFDDTDVAVAATSAVLALGTLPPGAMVIGHGIDLATPFTGGSVTAVDLDVGSTNADAIIDGADLFAAAVDGKASSVPAGIAPQGDYGGDAMTATIVSTTDDLANLTAGAATLRLFYTIL